MKYIDNACYNRLANAIIAQAAEDYRRVLHNRRYPPEKEETGFNETELKTFFHSQWLEFLGDWDGDTIMSIVERRFENECTNTVGENSHT